MLKDSIIKGNYATFKQGIHPPDFKELSNQHEITRMPFSTELVLPLTQHIGSESIPMVQMGQNVRRGQMIAKPGSFMGVALHSPVDGSVLSIDKEVNPSGELKRSITIKTDPYAAQKTNHTLPDLAQWKTEDFISHIQQSGIVGLGGAAFPAHVKLSIPEGKPCRFLMLNGCECEPYLTSDHRIMLDYPEKVIGGIRTMKKFLPFEKVFIAIEVNKYDAISKLQEQLTSTDSWIQIVPLQVKYPQGAEKMMISAILGKEVPRGKLPLDLGVLVCNVGTVAAVYDCIEFGKPLIERVVTITGDGVNNPANMWVPLGTPIRHVIEACGGFTHSDPLVILGGPMMGSIQKNLDAPVIKGTSGILVLKDKLTKKTTEYNCIRCGKCVDACPMFLNPGYMGLLAKKELYDEMKEFHVMDCFECGSCSFTCPSNIPLVQHFRIAKGRIREKQMKEKTQNS